MDISETEEFNTEVQHGPVSKQDRDKILKQEIRKKFEMLNQIGQESELFQKHAKLERVIVDVSTILPLFDRKCPHVSCDKTSKVINYKLSGGVLKVSWNCPNGHGGYGVITGAVSEKWSRHFFH